MEKRMLSTEEAWLVRETDPRFLEDTEIPYRREAVRHAQLMLELAQSRLMQLRKRSEDDSCSTLPNT